MDVMRQTLLTLFSRKIYIFSRINLEKNLFLIDLSTRIKRNTKCPTERTKKEKRIYKRNLSSGKRKCTKKRGQEDKKIRSDKQKTKKRKTDHKKMKIERGKI